MGLDAGSDAGDGKRPVRSDRHHIDPQARPGSAADGGRADGVPRLGGAGRDDVVARWVAMHFADDRRLRLVPHGVERRGLGSVRSIVLPDGRRVVAGVIGGVRLRGRHAGGPAGEHIVRAFGGDGVGGDGGRGAVAIVHVGEAGHVGRGARAAIGVECNVEIWQHAVFRGRIGCDAVAGHGVCHGDRRVEGIGAAHYRLDVGYGDASFGPCAGAGFAFVIAQWRGDVGDAAEERADDGWEGGTVVRYADVDGRARASGGVDDRCVVFERGHRHPGPLGVKRDGPGRIGVALGHGDGVAWLVSKLEISRVVRLVHLSNMKAKSATRGVVKSLGAIHEVSEEQPLNM